MWDILLNEHETMVVDSTRDFLSQELPIERLRPNGKAVDEQAIEAQAVELGLLGIGLDEQFGGTGLGVVGDILVQRECGRALASPNLLANALAAQLAANAGLGELAEQLVAGGKSASLAVPAHNGHVDTAKPVESYVFDWSAKRDILFIGPTGMGLFTADQLANAVIDDCIDNSLQLTQGQLTLHNSVAWADTTSPIYQRAQVMLAASLVGLAEQACDLTVEYAKVREQFGKPIGSFQAVKHRAADMGIRVRLAWYQTCMAALKLQENDSDVSLQVKSAKFLAGQAAHENGRASIQLHGAIGFQSECDVHWFMKRAHVYDRAGGAMSILARQLATEPAPFAVVD